MQPRKKPRNRHSAAMEVIGAQLAMFRINAGLTQRALGERTTASEETIASIEQGRRALMPHLASEFDQLLRTGGALATGVGKLPPKDKYPIWAEDFIAYEQQALALSWFEYGVLPGLLQTEDYARATFRSKIPLLDEETVERRVAGRLERQQILHRDKPLIASFVISEAIVAGNLGGREVMRAQLSHLRSCADLNGVSIQVLPLSREHHAGLDGQFVVLETADHQHLAYTEAQRSSELISDPDEVSILAQKYGMLRMQALNAEETVGLLERLLGER
ncbi:helix-turn-helix domain-containing protein [Streptomyces sp. G7(2002)]|uniref:helix-turn-helix domain-containing protein n=1 Tax=Streptomyces sp. G7(2002) TaxID=2971798 RepID=UPI00237DC6F1|nr:helix-turn-helix transcriptional regulator [Streptomyces sp. G7(2002)]WDT55477.1 helix-turn-helix domain-containing protein [Streptomyces sp. G7(2002)]